MKIINQSHQSFALQAPGMESQLSRPSAAGRAIINKDERLPASHLARWQPEKFQHALAVGKITNKYTAATGTAFRVGPGNMMMTNAHVLSSGNPRDYRIDFTDAEGRITSVDADRLLAFSPAPYERNPRPDISTREKMDFALFSIKPSQFDQVKRFGYLELDPKGARPGQKIYLPQHSRVEQKRPDGTVERLYHKTVALTDDAGAPGQPSRVRNVYPDKTFGPDNRRETVSYSADSNPGASGAPVISADSHKVVALNFGTQVDPLTLQPKINKGVNTASIWRLISNVFGEKTPDARPQMSSNIPVAPAQRWVMSNWRPPQ